VSHLAGRRGQAGRPSTVDWPCRLAAVGVLYNANLQDIRYQAKNHSLQWKNGDR
jgi:hypothetical protein